MDLQKVNFLFIVGAPRSGTTWLQRILGAHPAVASLDHELTIFSRYVSPMMARYRSEQDGIDRGTRQQGLPLVLTEDDMHYWLEDLLVKSYSSVLATKQGATLVLDKHPNYAQYLDVIEDFLPNAKVVHLIRDGRNVAVSMMSVRKREGHSPEEINSAAEIWRNFIVKAQTSHMSKTSRYMELRYEDLLKDGRPQVERVLEFAGIDNDRALVDQLCSDERLATRVSAPNKDLSGKRDSSGGAWRSELTLWQRFRFHRVSGSLLNELGYANGSWWYMNFIDRLRLPVLLVSKRFVKVLSALRNSLFSELK